jgi:hypothetical protein
MNTPGTYLTIEDGQRIIGALDTQVAVNKAAAKALESLALQADKYDAELAQVGEIQNRIILVLESIVDYLGLDNELHSIRVDQEGAA